MVEEMNTVEVPEPEQKNEIQRPSIEAAKEAGWSAAEIESAKKRSMLVEEPSTDEKGKQEKEEKGKAEAEAEAEAKETKAEEEKKKIAEKPKGNFLDEMDRELTPQQEKVLLETFPPGTKPRAFYFRAKNERHARQSAEARARELETRLKALESRQEEKKPVLDEEGNILDPEEQPLTLKQLRELESKKEEEAQKQQREQQERARVILEAQTFQEEYARASLPDFDDTVNRAKEVMQNLDVFVPEKWKQARVVSLIRDLQVKAANADKIGVDEDNAAFIAYEIGRYHPEYGKKAGKPEDGQKTVPKAAGGLTPEQMRRAEQNTQRRPSSASIPGGNGRRTVTADEVTIEDLNRMDFEKRIRFKKNHPEQYAKLLRG